MGRYEYFCPITGERITARTQTSDSNAPQQFYSPGASIEAIEAYEQGELDRFLNQKAIRPQDDLGEWRPQFKRHPHQVRA